MAKQLLTWQFEPMRAWRQEQVSWARASLGQAPAERGPRCWLLQALRQGRREVVLVLGEEGEELELQEQEVEPVLGACPSRSTST